MKNTIYVMAFSLLFLFGCNNPDEEVAVNEQLQTCVDLLSDCIEDCNCLDRCAIKLGKGDVDISDAQWASYLDCFQECQEKKIKKGTKAECRKSCQQAFFDCVRSNNG